MNGRSEDDIVRAAWRVYRDADPWPALRELEGFDSITYIRRKLASASEKEQAGGDWVARLLTNCYLGLDLTGGLLELVRALAELPATGWTQILLADTRHNLGIYASIREAGLSPSQQAGLRSSIELASTFPLLRLFITMPVVNYLTVDGEILSETRDGVERDYLPDPLGSTAALLDDTGAKTDEFTYWPYGETRTRTGTNPTPFTWVGTQGYYSDDSGAYARARTVSKELGRWVQVDPLWPEESAYGYVYGSPVTYQDPLGLLPDPTCLLLCGPICVAAFELCWECYDACSTAKDLNEFHKILDGVMKRRGKCSHPKTPSDCFRCPGSGGIFEDQCQQCMAKIGASDAFADCWCTYFRGQRPATGAAKCKPQPQPCKGIPEFDTSSILLGVSRI